MCVSYSLLSSRIIFLCIAGYALSIFFSCSSFCVILCWNSEYFCVDMTFMVSIILSGTTWIGVLFFSAMAQNQRSSAFGAYLRKSCGFVAFGCKDFGG